MGRRPEGSVFKRPGSHYYYTASTKYRLKPESAKTDSKAEAAEILRARIEEVKRGLRPDAAKIKFAELIYDKLASMLINKRSSYRNAMIRATKHILPFFGNSRALDVTPYRINTDFVNHRAKRRYGKKKIFKPVSNSEINRELDLIRSAFRLGRKQNQYTVDTALLPSKGFRMQRKRSTVSKKLNIQFNIQ